MQPPLQNGLGLPLFDPALGEDKAIPLIRIHDKSTKYPLPTIAFIPEKEALDLLKEINAPIALVYVCGKFRTGKSYLLNKAILERRDAFSVSPTINACTKGIWMWKRPFKIVSKNGEFGETAVIVLDAEGLDSLEGDIEHDSKIILLGILLSSLIIFNSVGSIDEFALGSLSLVVDMAKKLQGEQSEDPAKHSPSFLWVLRDFALQLKDNQGDPITSKQYLENALALQKGSSEGVEAKNRVRRLLKSFFPERDCAVLVRPTESEEELQNLLNLPEEKLRNEFVEQLAVVRTKIKKKIRPKHVNGKKANGKMLADLCVLYTEAINNGKIPSIENTWEYVLRSQCETGLKEVKKDYLELVHEKLMQNVILNKSEVKKIFEEIRIECIKKFNNRMVGEINANMDTALTKLLTDLKANAKNEFEDKSKATVKEYLIKRGEMIQQKLALSSFETFSQYKEVISQSLNDIPKTLKNSIRYFEVSNEVQTEILLKSMEELWTKTNEKLKVENEVLENTINTNKAEHEEERIRLEAKIAVLQEHSKIFSEETMKQKQKMEAELAALRSQLVEHETSIDKLKAELDVNESNAKAAVQQIVSLKEILAKKEKEIYTLTRKVQAYESPLLEKPVFKLGCETTRAGKVNLEKENAILRKQLGLFQGKLNEPTSTKSLMPTIDQLQRHCAALEAKIKHEKRFREVLSAASHIECKGCGQLYACNLFAAHTKLCKQIHEGKFAGIPQTSRHKPQEYKIKIRYNGKNWVVRKSLKDFEELSKELAKEYPNTKIPGSLGLFDFEETGSEEPVERKQRYLEAYLRELIQHDGVRNMKKFKQFLGIEDFD